MLNSLMVYITLVIICDLAGAIFAKLWYTQGHPFFLVATLAAFALTGYFFALSVRFERVGIANALWTSLSTIVVAIIGYIFFKENISLNQVIGIVVIAAGLFVMNIK